MIGGAIGGTTTPNPVGSTLVIDGQVVDLTATDILLDSLTPHIKDGVPSLHFSRRGIALAARPDPYCGLIAAVYLEGLPVYAGRIVGVSTHYDDKFGWAQEYESQGLKSELDHVPVTNDNDFTDTVSYNLHATDPGYLAARAGRTVGQMILEVLESGEISAALIALGIGGQTSGGSGASGRVSVSAGQVVDPVLDFGGSGYTEAPTLVFTGGGYAVQATGHATVSTSGVVTGIVIDTPGSGYRTAPTVVLSRLPSATLNDLAGLDAIPPQAVNFSGEKLISAIDGVLRTYYPSWTTHVEPSGLIRFFDTRAYGSTVCSITGTATRQGRVSPIVIDGSIAGIQIDDPGEGIVSATLHIASPTGTGAAVTLLTDGGAIIGANIAEGGSNYGGPASTVVLGRDRAWLGRVVETDAEGYPRVVIRGRPIVEPAILSLSLGTLAEDFAHDGLTNAQAKLNWKLSDFVAPAQPGGVATATAPVSSGAVGAATVTATGYGYDDASPPAVTVTPSGGTGGSGASFTATVAGGQVTGLTRVSGGTGYTAVTLAIAPPGPPGQSLVGTCTMPDTLTVVITPSDATIAIGADYLDQTDSGAHGALLLTWSAGTDITQTFSALVIANTALSAGGACSLTLDRAAPHVHFDGFYLTMDSVSGGSRVWRQYRLPIAAQAAAQADQFSQEVPFPNAAGNSALLTTTPRVTVLWSADGEAPYDEEEASFTFDPVAGTMTVLKPVLEYFGTTALLQQGGSAVDGIPADIRYFAALNKGALTATYPPDVDGAPQFAGTVYAEQGIERTLYIMMDNWKDPSNQANMDKLALDAWRSVANVIVEGSVDVGRLCVAAMLPGQSMTLAGAGYPTPWDSLSLPVLSATLTWAQSMDGLTYKVTHNFSNRQAPYTASPYFRPSQVGALIGGAQGLGLEPLLPSAGGYPGGDSPGGDY